MIIRDRPISRFESVAAHFGQNCADLIDTNRGIVETFADELRDMHEAVSDPAQCATKLSKLSMSKTTFLLIVETVEQRTPRAFSGNEHVNVDGFLYENMVMFKSELPAGGRLVGIFFGHLFLIY
jgi:hypothetical protein